MKPNKWLKWIFYTQIVIFILLVSFFIIPRDLNRKLFLIAAVFAGVFLILGIVTIVLTIRYKQTKFLLLTGIGSAGFFLGSILHNVFYAFGIMLEDITILRYLMEILHVGFFLFAVIVCPILFLIGMIGTIVVFVKKK